MTCVTAMVAVLSEFNIPLHCKIRLMEGLDSKGLTVDLCRYCRCRIMRTLYVVHTVRYY